MWLVGARIVDVVDGVYLEADTMEISGDSIASLGGTPPAGAEVLDLEGAAVIPGLVTCHAHLSQEYPFSLTDVSESPAVSFARAVRRAREALVVGVTTIRCVSEMHSVDVWLRDAEREGTIQVPRISAGGRGLSVTGGHGAVYDVFADGAEGFRKAARTELALGADHVKIFVSGGIAETGENLNECQMTVEEIRAVVEAARTHQKYVVAHTGAPGPTNVALDAGVLSFEHGYRLDKPTAKRMADAGAYFGATLSVTALRSWMRSEGFPDDLLQRSADLAEDHLISVRRAIQAGVTLVNSTDLPPGGLDDGACLVVREMELLVRAGLSHAEALRASTLNGARLCGLDGVTGSIEEGKSADLIVVEGDPLIDVSTVKNVLRVFHRGEPVDLASRPTPAFTRA